MRRKSGQLVPLEVAICAAVSDLRAQGIGAVHGYELAKTLAHAADVQQLTAYGTLYRALGRLEKMGLLTSQWEDAAIPARENRPGRRLYALTAAGESAVIAARRSKRTSTSRRSPRLAPA